MKSLLTRHQKISLSLLLLVIVFGTVGYRLLGGREWSFVDALYMTIITITTVGYREVHEPLGPTLMVFTVVLLVVGVGTTLYVLGSMAQVTIEGKMNAIIRRRRLDKKIHALKDHYIVCGCGRMGLLIARQLAEKPLPVVVVERDEAKINKAEEEGLPYIFADATDEDALVRAGIQRAKGLITALGTDADNVYVTLTARELNPKLYILARAGEEGSDKKLLRAGANKVVSPYTIGGMRMAEAVLRPAVVDFIEIATMKRTIDLQLEEVRVGPTSKLVGTTLLDSHIRKDFDSIIIGIKKSSNEMIFNPTPDYRIEANDTLIALGKREDMVRMEKAFAG